jgi:hypothetical protein
VVLAARPRVSSSRSTTGGTKAELFVPGQPALPGRPGPAHARVRRYRDDKTAAAADTLATVQAIYRHATGLDPPPRRGPV